MLNLLHLKESKFILSISYKKAALLTAAFFISTGANAQKKESYKDLIKKAQVLVLQKDRAQGVQLLNAAISKEPQRSVARKELQKEVKKLSEIFISDDGQRAFELAKSMRKTDLQISTDKLKEALMLEPGQSEIMFELASNYILLSDFKKAKPINEQLRVMMPWSQNFYIQQLLIQYGLQDIISDLGTQTLEILDESQKSNAVMFVYEALVKMQKNPDSDHHTNRQLLIRAEKLDPEYPEIYYANIKLNLLEIKDSLKDINTYLAKCDSPVIASKYADLDPLSCSRKQEVAKLLKKLEKGL